MTKITKAEVKKVAHLARLELNENEINNHAQQLEKILDYIKQLEKIDTDDVPCTTCLLYTSPSPRDLKLSRMPSSA